MRIIRELRNVLDGPYRILDGQEDKDEKKRGQAGAGFSEGESRVVRKLIDIGLVVPQKDSAKKKPRW